MWPRNHPITKGPLQSNPTNSMKYVKRGILMTEDSKCQVWHWLFVRRASYKMIQCSRNYDWIYQICLLILFVTHIVNSTVEDLILEWSDCRFISAWTVHIHSTLHSKQLTKYVNTMHFSIWKHNKFIHWWRYSLRDAFKSPPAFVIKSMASWRDKLHSFMTSESSLPLITMSGFFSSSFCIIAFITSAEFPSWHSAPWLAIVDPWSTDLDIWPLWSIFIQKGVTCFSSLKEFLYN